ncbi:MAG: glutamate 5-kinase [Candidatus Aureabacteria bacterium]|nr:glutamate 5-kinase [Candidatus Auribacterota bacterium]
MDNSRQKLKDISSLVVKVGSNVLTDGRGKIDKKIISSLAGQIHELKERGKKVILVTSGAIAAGRWKLGYDKKELTLRQKQAAAAVGQSQLMRFYEDAFFGKGIVTGQVLLTDDGLSDRVRQLNAKNTLLTLLEKDVVPVINENDTVSVEEIQFGDNDRLSALVAQMTGTELLILLTDTQGLMDKDPKDCKDAKRIAVVKEIKEDIECLCGKKGSSFSTGGMISKIRSAKMVTRSGESAVIADGKEENVLLKILDGKDVGTLFLPCGSKLAGRKRWIAHFQKPKGSITVDSGAAQALVNRGKSLLASGIKFVNGDFSIGDVIVIRDEGGNDFACGQANYCSSDIGKIKGLKTSQIDKILGKKDYDEVIHRDNMVIF